MNHRAFNIACIVLSIGVVSHAYATEMIVNGADWKDTDGIHISCHDGGLSRFGDTFYWYGTSYIGNPGGTFGFYAHKLQNGFNVYSSKDLVNWKRKGVCLDFSTTNNVIRGTAHRPNVIYNDKTRKYVMWFFDFIQYPDVMMTVAISDSAIGPFKILGRRETGAPQGYAQDCGLFKDEDGKAYLVYDDGDRNLRVDLLSDDYLSSTKKTVIALKPSHEGAAMIKYKSKYIVAGSGVCGWSGSETHYAVADSPLGPYSEKKQMSEKSTWGSQISNFIFIRESDTVMALCDQWWAGPKGGNDLDDSRYLFLPVSMNTHTNEVKLEYKAKWNPFEIKTDISK